MKLTRRGVPGLIIGGFIGIAVFVASRHSDNMMIVAILLGGALLQVIAWVSRDQTRIEELEKASKDRDAT